MAQNLWRYRNRISAQIEFFEFWQLTDRLRQRAQLVGAEVEGLEAGELTDRLRQRAQLVGAEG